MKGIKRKLILSVFVVISLLILAGNSWSQIGLPHTFFDGLVETYLDNGTGDDLIFLYTSIYSITYSDGTSGSGDSILWSTVTITGSKRTPLATPGTTFTPATLTVSDGTTTYLSATLKNIEFVLVGGLWRLNPDLDINNPSTINLADISLDPGPIPSQYILDLQAALGSQTIAGMTMTLDVFNGDITGNSQSVILEGLIAAPVVEGPTVARSVGYWKNHNEEREAFINAAVSDSIDVLNVFDTDSALRYYLTKEGKKTMLEKAKQQLAALLLNISAGLNPSTPLTMGQLELIDPYFASIPEGDGVEDTIGDAVIDIENAILISSVGLERAKDLADEINNGK